MSTSTFEQNAVYLQSGDPTREDVATLHAPGTLGARFTIQHPIGRGTPSTPPRTKRFQVVRVDPLAATAPVAGAPAYWQDRANYVVTPTPTVLNQICGVFRNVITRGNYGCIQNGGVAPVRVSDADATASVVGDSLIGGAVGLAVRVAAGTAPGSQRLGTVASPLTKDTTGGTGNHTVLADLHVPDML